MRNHQQKLIQLITENPFPTSEQLDFVFKSLEVNDLANIFVDTTFLITAVQFLQEKYWLEKKERSDEVVFSHFIKKFLKFEIAPALFFHSTLSESSLEEIEYFKKNCQIIQKHILLYCKKLISPNNKNFATLVLKKMSELFEFEYQLVQKKSNEGLQLEYSLYRSFDILDDFFNFNYDMKESSFVWSSNERLYLGSGASVQSSYVTILLALRYLKLPIGSSFVDLGSGFGRVGLVIGLLRPDIHFTGYEFVEERVNAANHACQSLEIISNVKFFTQDLSSKDFSIPNSQTYYMFDPFSDETYKHVLSQLHKIGDREKINIITKGNAKQQLNNANTKGLWSKPQEFEHANFCLFRS